MVSGGCVSSLLPARFGDGVRVLRTSGAFPNLDNRETWTPISCPAHNLNTTGDKVWVYLDILQNRVYEKGTQSPDRTGSDLKLLTVLSSIMSKHHTSASPIKALALDMHDNLLVLKLNSCLFPKSCTINRMCEEKRQKTRPENKNSPVEVVSWSNHIQT